MTKVLITGGTGVIGSRLTEMLVDCGHGVVRLSREARNSDLGPVYHWDAMAGKIDAGALEGVESVIHLAGEGIADKKWTDERKRQIMDSRVRTADFLREQCEKHNIRLRNYISASAIGWYPLEITSKKLDEISTPGKGFLAEVCQRWEQSADQFSSLAEYVAKVRIGLVLARDTGVLKRTSVPVHYYLAAGLGSGKQAMPWIHIDDVCRIFVHILENNLGGVYNAVGPETATNQDFMQTLADVLEKPLLLPNIPDFLIRWVFGSRADLLLKGGTVSSKKIRETGFSFDYPTLNTALSNIYGLIVSSH